MHCMDISLHTQCTIWYMYTSQSACMPKCSSYASNQSTMHAKVTIEWPKRCMLILMCTGMSNRHCCTPLQSYKSSIYSRIYIYIYIYMYIYTDHVTHSRDRHIWAYRGGMRGMKCVHTCSAIAIALRLSSALAYSTACCRTALSSSANVSAVALCVCSAITCVVSCRVWGKLSRSCVRQALPAMPRTNITCKLLSGVRHGPMVKHARMHLL